MLVRYLRNEHPIVTLAAILEEDTEDFPDGGNDTVFLLAVLDQFFHELVEADGVD